MRKRKSIQQKRRVFFLVLFFLIFEAAVLAGASFFIRGPVLPAAVQAQTNQCDNSAAISQFNGCKSEALKAKTECIQGCEFYRTDPCYGECETNYNQCTSECNAGFSSALNICGDTFADNSVNCANNNDGDVAPDAGGNQEKLPPKTVKTKCTEQDRKLAVAREKVNAACKGIEYPERLLDKAQGRQQNPFQQPLCDTLKKQMDDDKATLERAEKHLEEFISEKKFQESILQNQRSGFEDLLDQYEKLQEDVNNYKAKLDEASEKFSEIKSESDIAWIEAIAGTAGPFGTYADGVIWASREIVGIPTGHIRARVGIDFASHGAEYGLEKLFEYGGKSALDVGRWTAENSKRALAGAEPLAFIGVFYDGLELQELKNKTHEIEQEFNKVRGWYEDAVTGLESFKKRSDYEKLMSLEKKIADTLQKIKLLEIDIDSLQKQIPVMKHTLGIAQELYDKCVKDQKKEEQELAQQESCRKALQEEQAAKKAVGDCK